MTKKDWNRCRRDDESNTVQIIKGAYNCTKVFAENGGCMYRTDSNPIRLGSVK